MKITTWNVNGLRARLTHIVDFLRAHEPDVLCLQETKVPDELFPREPIEDQGYDVALFGQKGYNGLAILSRLPLADVVRGLPDDPPDAERRVLAATTGGLRVLNLYVPNGQEVGCDKYRFKLDWFRRLRAFLDAAYAATEPIVVVGDFNVTLDDRDVHDPAWWREKILCSTPERQALRAVLAFGLDDALRRHHAEAGIYTWWHYTAGAAFKDDGLRIDYVLTSRAVTTRCTDVIVHKDLRLQKSPSDHVPVTAVLGDDGAAP
ncbi:MAG: exodeoxyribonuclease III [Planctomycetes bacterium]|nr:exodeoxyribonuclease III [Planctomycetota bacterium]